LAVTVIVAMRIVEVALNAVVNVVITIVVTVIVMTAIPAIAMIVMTDVVVARCQ
jgi:hypothetical protein